MHCFFDLIDGSAVERDAFGADFDGMDEVWGMAASLVVEAARAEPCLKDDRLFACEVRDEDGQVIHRANLTFWTSRV